MRTVTVIMRIALSFIAVILFIIGLLGAFGMALSSKPEISGLVFVIMILTLSVLLFKTSAWTIRNYLIYDDKLEIKILGGIKTITYPADQLKAFNDLKVLVLNHRNTGVGILTTDNKLIKVLELEVADFPIFVDHLQKLVRWDLTLKFAGLGGYAS